MIGSHNDLAGFENLRAMNDYPGATERMNKLVRRLKNHRDNSKLEIVFTAHEDIEKIYAKGGMVAAKGQPAPDPIAVKGWPDIPGRRAPDEFCRAADNVLRVRYVNGKPQWIGRREPIGPGAEYWEVKTHFNAPAIQGGILPPSYSELAKLCEGHPEYNWQPPYIWVLYGPFGIGKTLSLRSFPRPMLIFDLDHGTNVIPQSDREGIEIITDLDPEESNHYNTFLARMEAAAQ